MDFPKIYPSEIDIWLALIIVAAPMVTIFVGIYLLQSGILRGLATIGVGIIAAVLIAMLLIPCRYTINSETIEVRCGLVHDVIDIKNIKSLELSNDPLSAPALSLKRVKIQVGNGYKLLSPVNREEFIRDVESLMSVVKP